MEALKAISLPPGFGFHPTDVELISHYLRRKNQGLKFDFEVIPELDIYKREPWDLPACCQMPTRDSKWHFFTSRDRKYPNGARANRATEAGYWKSTGKDRNIRSQNRVIGTKKTLVFHEGRPPHGKRTDWIMHEYFMDEKESKTISRMKEAYVLCRVMKRNGFAVADQTEEADDCQNTVKKLYASAQVSLSQEESSQSESTEDLEAWFEELFDPHFDGAVFNVTSFPAIESTNESHVSPAGLSTLIPKNEPQDFSFLQEEIMEIPHFDFTGIPAINVTSSPMDLNRSGTAYFKKEMPDLPKATKFIGIQTRDHCAIPPIGTFHHNTKLQVQTNKMESRNNASVIQTIKFAHVDHHISTNSGPHRKINVEEAKKREIVQDGIKGLLAVLRSFFSRVRQFMGSFPAFGL